MGEMKGRLTFTEKRRMGILENGNLKKKLQRWWCCFLWTKESVCFVLRSDFLDSPDWDAFCDWEGDSVPLLFLLGLARLAEALVRSWLIISAATCVGVVSAGLF